MKDIGSIFPLYDSDMKPVSVETGFAVNQEKMYYSLCREALYAIAESLDGKNKQVLLPAYTCDTVITPFKELGWECHYFSLGKNLRMNRESVKEIFRQYQCSLIVVHPYYGMELNEEEADLLKELHALGSKIVVDVTQGIYTMQELDFVDYYVGSYRKWFKVPDGAFLKSSQGLENIQHPLEENEDFVSTQKRAMYLRGSYFVSQNQQEKDVSIKLNKEAERMVDHKITPHKMSTFSYSILKNNNEFIESQKQRIENYRFLHENISKIREVGLVCEDMGEVKTAPLYFTIYVQDRRALQSTLAEAHIYAPVIWPVVYDEVLIDNNVDYIYKSLLAIPIDQRNSQEEMVRIIETITNHYHD